MADTAGKPITCKAMVAFGVNDLREEDVRREAGVIVLKAEQLQRQQSWGAAALRRRLWWALRRPVRSG